MIGGELCPMFGLERLDRAMRPAMPPAINAQMMMKITKPKNASTRSSSAVHVPSGFRSFAISANGTNEMSDIEGKAASEAASECGSRASSTLAGATWRGARSKMEQLIYVSHVYHQNCQRIVG